MYARTLFDMTQVGLHLNDVKTPEKATCGANCTRLVKYLDRMYMGDVRYCGQWEIVRHWLTGDYRSRKHGALRYERFDTAQSCGEYLAGKGATWEQWRKE